MSKGNTKAQNMTGALSTESILITVESNWIQMFGLSGPSGLSGLSRVFGCLDSLGQATKQTK